MANRRDEDAAREIEAHLELEAEERAADGLSTIEARHAARRRFGSVTQIDPANREDWNRSRHMFHLIGRLKAGVSAAQAEAELDSLVARRGELAGVSRHVFTPGVHILQMEPVQDRIVGSASRAI